jgi:Protein of unknown function (DUF3551)
MRNAKWMMLAVLVSGAAMFGDTTPAAAYDHPWCLQGRGVGIPGDCSYDTYEQCMTTASGRDLYCNVNPRTAFDRRAQPYPRRYYRD